MQIWLDSVKGYSMSGRIQNGLDCEREGTKLVHSGRVQSLLNSVSRRVQNWLESGEGAQSCLASVCSGFRTGSQRLEREGAELAQLCERKGTELAQHCEREDAEVARQCEGIYRAGLTM